MVIPAVLMLLLWHYIHTIQLTISIKQITYCLKQVCYNSCQWCPSDVERQFKVENNAEHCINVEMMLHACWEYNRYGRGLSYQNIRKKVTYNQSRIGMKYV
jgi:hypothetical protein